MYVVCSCIVCRDASDNLGDFLEDLCKIMHHFLIPEPDHSKSFLFQDFLSFSIVFLLSVMNATIYFDNQAMLNCTKVDDEMSPYDLSTEFYSCATLGPENIPQF